MSKALRLIATILLLTSFITISVASQAEHDAWQCSGCGRTGNMGNYCGGCAHPAPWIEVEPSSTHNKETAYQNALTHMNNGNYLEASEAFKALGDYKDSAAKANESAALQSKETAYQSADALQTKGELAKAAIAFGKLGDYKDAKTRSFALWDRVAQRDTISAGEYHTVGLKQTARLWLWDGMNTARAMSPTGTILSQFLLVGNKQ